MLILVVIAVPSIRLLANQYDQPKPDLTIKVIGNVTIAVVLTNPEIEHRDDVLCGMLALLEQPNDYVTVSCRDVNGMWLAGPQVDYSKHGRLPVPAGAHFHFCAMLRRELFERVGGFDEAYRHGRSCDDNDWLWSLDAAGARFRLAPGVVWHHATPHAYDGVHATNRDRLVRKWGHRWT